MRLAPRGANPTEWLALRASLVPVAAADAWGGMALSAVVAAAVRSGRYRPSRSARRWLDAASPLSVTKR